MSAPLVDDLDGLRPSVYKEQSVIQFLPDRVVIRVQTSGSDNYPLPFVWSCILLHLAHSFLIGARPIRTALPRAKIRQKTVGATCCAVLPPDMAQPAGGLSQLSSMVSKKVDYLWLRMRPRSWWHMTESNRPPGAEVAPPDRPSCAVCAAG